MKPLYPETVYYSSSATMLNVPEDYLYLMQDIERTPIRRPVVVTRHTFVVCRSCQVPQEMGEVGVCKCCGAPLPMPHE